MVSPIQGPPDSQLRIVPIVGVGRRVQTQAISSSRQRRRATWMAIRMEERWKEEAGVLHGRVAQNDS